MLDIFKTCDPDKYVNSFGEIVAESGQYDKLPFEEWLEAVLINEEDDWDEEFHAEFMSEYYASGCEDFAENVPNSVCFDLEAWQAEYNNEYDYLNAMASNTGDGMAITDVVKGKCRYSPIKILAGIGIVFGGIYFIMRKKK